MELTALLALRLLMLVFPSSIWSFLIKQVFFGCLWLRLLLKLMLLFSLLFSFKPKPSVKSD